MKTPELSEWSEDSESIEIILDQPNRPETFRHHDTTTPETKMNNTYWWLPKLEQPSQRHMNEFNNFSESYLCNSIWWENTNPIQYP